MPIQQTYKTGTITVVSGSATVTGSGTFWTAGLVNGGELSFKGFSVPIISVDSDTSLTLDYVAPAAMAGSGAYSVSLGRADAASAIVANRLLADLTDLLRSKVSPFAATILDDLNAAAVRATIGAIGASDVTASDILTKLLTVDTDTAGINATTLKSVTPSTFALSLLDDVDAGTALTTLGVSAFIKTLLDDANATTALSTLGVSAFAKTILDDASSSAVFSTLGINSRVWSDDEAPRQIANTGYQKLPGGLIIQWGVGGFTDGSIITFPVAFPTIAASIMVSPAYGAGSAETATAFVSLSNKSSFTVRVRFVNNGGLVGPANGYITSWMAMGY